jgi:hypothetical protein
MRLLTKFMELYLGFVFISWFVWSCIPRPLKRHSDETN